LAWTECNVVKGAEIAKGRKAGLTVFEVLGDHLAAEGDFDVFDDRVRWKIEDISEVNAGLEFHIVNRACGFIVEMAVLIEVGAITGRFAVEVDLADDFMLHQGL
jgi:hypothetical protein